METITDLLYVDLNGEELTMTVVLTICHVNENRKCSSLHTTI